MELKVLDIQGKETGRVVSLEDTVFGVQPNEHAIYLEIKQFLAAQRQGTHKSKERSEVKGSTRKIRKQKGSGGARFGDIKNPLFKGGGRIFGPRPRSYDFKLNRNLKRVAKRSIFSLKQSNSQIQVIENFNFDKPKTKELINIFKALNIFDRKILFVLGDSNNNVYLSSRNLKGVKVVTVSELNSYDLLNASALLLQEGSLELITNNLTK